MCGKRLNKAKGRDRSYIVEEKKEELVQVFGLDTSTDSPDIHPYKFCHSCMVYIRSWKQRGGGQQSQSRVYMWTPHNEPECTVSKFILTLLVVLPVCQVCEHFRTLATGGGRAATPKIGRPKTSTLETAAAIAAMAPPSFFPHSLPVSDFPTTNTHTCIICMNTLDQPIELLCGSLVCLCCIDKWLTSRREDCPCCISLLHNHARRPSRVTMDVLGSQLVECPRGCNRTVQLRMYTQHHQSHCQSFFEHSTCSPSRTTISDILDRKTEPTTQAEQRVARNIIKRLMAESNDSQVLQVPTGGQVNKI